MYKPLNDPNKSHDPRATYLGLSMVYLGLAAATWRGAPKEVVIAAYILAGLLYVRLAGGRRT